MSSKTLLEKTSFNLNDVAELINNENVDEAISSLQSHLKENPDDFQALHLLGVAFAKKGEYINAERAFKEELKLNKSRVDAYFNLGLIHSQQNRLPEAKNDYENVIKLNPDDALALNDLGVINYTLGDIEKSRDCFSKALKVNPAFKDAFLNLFELSWNGEKYSLALEYAYNFLKKLSPEDTSRIASDDEQTDGSFKNNISRQTLSLHKSAPLLAVDTPAVSFNKNSLITKSDKLEIFNKLVPDDLRDKKTGMNIALAADTNTAGQVSLLCKLINEQTIHRARFIVYEDNHSGFDNDIVLFKNRIPVSGETLNTARKIIENADFYHIGGHPQASNDFKVMEFLRSNNTLIQYFDGLIHKNIERIYNWHKENNITGISTCGQVIPGNLPMLYHINLMFDYANVKRAPKPEGTIKIVYSPSGISPENKDVFFETIVKLQENYSVEPVVVEGNTSAERLEIKSRTNMSFDQMFSGNYGISAVESMAVGHAVFCGISNLSASILPDSPVIYVTPDNLEKTVERYLVNKNKITQRGRAGINWVKLHHSPEKILKQYLYLYDYVKHGAKLLSHPDDQLLRQQL